MKAIITGASSGIGKEFSFLLAERNYDLILISNEKDKLDLLKKQLEENYKIFVDILPLDLVDEISLKIISNYAQNTDLLINDAGFGLMGNLWELNEKKLSNLIDVNIKALTILSRNFSKEMLKNGNGRIINVASSVAYMKGWSSMATYVGSKHYVKIFSKSLNLELKKMSKNVKVQILFPGAISTHFYNKDTTTYNINHFTPAKKFAKKALKYLLDKNKKEVTLGKFAKILKYFSWMIPLRIQSWLFTIKMHK